MTIGVDFDDVLYPYHHYLKQRIRARWGIDLSGERVTTFYYEHHPSLVARGVTREALWAEIQGAWLVAEDHAHAALLDPDAPKILEDLQRRHRVVLISARSTNALPFLESFLERHAIRPHEIQLGRQEKRGFDVLVDDFPKHVEENAVAGGHSILYTSDENSNFDESRLPRVHRVHSWREASQVIERIDARRTGHA
ncbi:MAG: hypothetical protein HYT80_01635 [Euryarchaeota archaeon]|nr:hypothetical protein [Euryarchaeota archaeon]